MRICKVILSFGLGDTIDKPTQSTRSILVAKLYPPLVQATPVTGHTSTYLIYLSGIT